MMTLLLKRRHNMMTLRLKKCVSLFVCLSLLVSACSPDKSSKAGEFTRNTKVEVGEEEQTTTIVEDEKEEELLPHNSGNSFCDKHKWCSVPRDTWGTITSDREIGKVGGFSVTPKRLAVSIGIGITVVVLGTVAVGVWYKWRKKSSTQQQPAQDNVNANADNGNNIIVNNNEGGGKDTLTGTGTDKDGKGDSAGEEGKKKGAEQKKQ
ncbi:MAG: hypothetical protein LE180_05970 [Endomicrobium sp.]|uniref:hypothetical protein n=1 Tax=Candidatus Endomicrobiellum pyrsonymphae TaxID=1408203 RepID=UPI00357FC562|nr:hypothetical protein [Endomicrobium sp.]